MLEMSASHPEPDSETDHTCTSPFRTEAEGTLRDLQCSLAQLLSSLPGNGQIRRATDLQKALKTPTKLAWQIHKVVGANDPLVEATNVPGRAAMQRFLNAARRCGSPTDQVAAVVDAYQRFDNLIKVHAGSRTTFDSMIDGLVGRRSDQMDLVHQRAAFTANSHIWGVQAQTQLACFALKPNPDNPLRLDTFTIRGLVGLRRLRADAPWTISTTRLIDDDGKVQKTVAREPLDPRNDKSNPIGLLYDFGTQPPPEFRTIAMGAGYINFELKQGSVGKLSAIDCINGFIWRGVIPRYVEPNNRIARFSSKVRTPCESIVLDVILHDSVYENIKPTMEIYGDHRGSDSESPDRQVDLLAIQAQALAFGNGARVLRTPEVPRYVDMANYGFDRMGWNSEEFRVYRCHLRFPVMPSSVIMRFELPQVP